MTRPNAMGGNARSGANGWSGPGAGRQSSQRNRPVTRLRPVCFDTSRTVLGKRDESIQDHLLFARLPA